MPRGTVRFGQKCVRSHAIDVAISNATCTLSGRFDSVVEFDDGTYGVIDFKTSSARGEHIPLYSRQLHAYAYALEHPAAGQLALTPITKLGLLVFEPGSFVHRPDQTAHLAGKLTWIEVPRDDGAFLEFLQQVVAVVAQPAPPEPAPGCTWCGYRRASRETNL
jgi:hypothetical protein